MDSNFDNEILHASNERLVEMLRVARGEAAGFKKLAVAHGNTAAEYGCWLSALKDILLEGKEVSEFEESEPVVRAALDLRREVEALSKQEAVTASLRAALVKYGRHLPGCAITTTGGDCDCGFSAHETYGQDVVAIKSFDGGWE